MTRRNVKVVVLWWSAINVYIFFVSPILHSQFSRSACSADEILASTAIRPASFKYAVDQIKMVPYEWRKAESV